MRKLILINFVILFCCVSSKSQSPKLFSINSSGGTIQMETKTILSFTLGDPFIETIRSNSVYLTQGFQQPLLNVISTKVEYTDTMISAVKIYPNPTEGYVTIEFLEATIADINMELLDIKGSLIFSGVIKKGTSKHLFSISDKTPGIYNIILTSNSQINSYKLIKL